MNKSVQVTNQVEKGAAISKAMAYYHYPKDWKVHPNFFNPYWKAKLQPYRGTEAALVLGFDGNYDHAFDAAILAGGSELLNATGIGSVPMP